MDCLIVASNFPDEFYPTIAPWSKLQVDALHKYTDVKVEVVVARPFTIPLKGFPYYKFASLPLRTVSDTGYNVHFPRFPFPIPKRLFFSLTGNLYSSFITRYIVENCSKPDLIHARFTYIDGYGMINLCDKWKIPLVVDVHGSIEFEEYYFSTFLKKKQRSTINRANKLLCVAQWQVTKGLELGIPEEKLECVPLGVDTNIFKPRDKESIRQEFGLQEQKIVLYNGQLIERKGVNFLLNAISKLDKSHKKDSKFIIAGDGPEMKNLKALSTELNLQDTVLFTGMVSETDLLKWYSLADIFVLPSLSEGRPTVINQAMASECAIIATNVSGIPEQVENGHNGYLVEPKNIDMLAEKISYLLNNESEIVRLGKNSRKRVIDNGWSWEGYAKKIKNIYKLVVENI
jgi:teichuronic acid biosynthesis glycosyltransferase TuaC